MTAERLPFARLVKRRLQETGRTPREVAEHMKVTTGQVYAMTTGASLVATWRVRLLAQALRVPVGDVLKAVEAQKERTLVVR